MLSRSALVGRVCSRQVHASSSLLAQDQIQKMFLDKVKEYGQKQSTAPGGLVDPTPESEKGMEDELNRLAKVYRMKSTQDAKTFPTMKFEEPTFEPNRQFGNAGEYTGKLEIQEGEKLRDHL